MTSSIPPEGDPSQGAGRRDERPAVLTSDQLLPPVEPPSAGFILQLFVIPAVIVAAVVLLWFVIESLAKRDEQNLDEIIAALRSSSQARFQRANELVDLLRSPRYPELKVNREWAQKLAALLDEQIDAAAETDADAAVTMRIILSRALGQFQVTDGLPVLIKAAQSDPERDVRRQALSAIAILAGAMAELNPPQPIDDETLTEAMLELSDDQDELMRSETAFALTVLASSPGGDPRLGAALEALADDPYIDARFNAAIGLARLGNPQAAAVVGEMLDSEALASSVSGEKAMTEEVTEDSLAGQRSFKRKQIIGNALKTVQQLVDHPATTDETLAALDATLVKFIAAVPELDEPQQVRAEISAAAERTLAKVRGRRSGK